MVRSVPSPRCAMTEPQPRCAKSVPRPSPDRGVPRPGHGRATTGPRPSHDRATTEPRPRWDDQAPTEVCHDRATTEVCQVRGVPRPSHDRGVTTEPRPRWDDRATTEVCHCPRCAKSEVCHGRVVRTLRGGVPRSRCAKPEACHGCVVGAEVCHGRGVPSPRCWMCTCTFITAKAHILEFFEKTRKAQYVACNRNNKRLELKHPDSTWPWSATTQGWVCTCTQLWGGGHDTPGQGARAQIGRASCRERV